MENDTANRDTHKDFFISYAHQDWQWAKWINQQLEDAGYSTILPDRDFLPGRSVPLEIHKAVQAKRTIAVLSPDYLASQFTQLEWTSVLYQDPTGAKGLLLPVRVHHCNVGGILAPLIYIDLVGLGMENEANEAKARKILLDGVRQTPRTLKPANFPSLVIANQSSQQARFGAPFPEYWNVARRHAPYFTGRDDQIEQIFQAFTLKRDAAQIPDPQALVGLGGLGKTQTAAEYAYRYRENYKAVLWARADTKKNLMANFRSLVRLLKLPKQEDPRETMRQWFTAESDWLLILDNADDLQIIDPFLPRAQRGHVLVTTRVRGARSVAQPILLDPLSPEDGALCILRRAGSIPGNGQLHDASSSRVDAARHLSELMDGLPLALEQAGAYIEDTGSSVSRYLSIYEQYRAQIIQRQYGALPNYPASVAAAWTLSKDIVQQEKPAAFELLQLCAFLAPDAIPEEIFTKGADVLGPVLKPIVANSHNINITTITLRKYSLLNREVKGEEDIPRFSMHRMMQEIIRDEMDEPTWLLWAERAVRAVSRALPSGEEQIIEEPIIQAHVRHCLPLIEKGKMTFPEAERLRQYAENTLDSSDE